MIVTYDGREFSGFQKQSSRRTIQGELENALFIIFKKEIECVGSGRTDAKVSAYYQPVHFDIEKVIDTKKTMHSLNGLLPSAIRVLSINESEIHARFSAKKKTYLYKMYLSPFNKPLHDDALRIDTDINIKNMKKFCKIIRGTHDFSGFKASGGQTKNDVRTIYKAQLKKHKDRLDFYITGNGFLYKMVRNIVGSMLEAGKGKLDIKNLKQNFNDFKSKHTAPPEFLYLYSVVYK